MSDGKVSIEIDLDRNDLDRELDKMEGDVEKSAGRIGNSISKLSDQTVEYAKNAALGITAVTGAILGMSIKAAGDMQAMNAQFEQVFTGSNGDSLVSQAETAVDAIVKETGILPNRLKPTFTAMAAFAKTAGMDTADALSLTERATLAAADGAAFYDKSIEEVSESLQSFLKGNYANDAALGISATETTRNAAANDLYGKSFNDLDEAQKQLTLLKMVEDGNKLSGAMGQAARESDGLENVLGNIKRVINDVAAAFGSPILEPFVNITKSATDALREFAEILTANPQLVYVIIGALTTLVTALGAVWIAANKVKILQSLSSAFALVTNPIFLIVLAIGALVTAFVYLYNTNEDFRNKVTEIWNGIKSFMLPVIESIKNFLVNTWTNILNWWSENQESIKNTILNVWNAISEFLKPIIQFVVDFIINLWNAASEWWATNQESIKNTIINAWNAISAFLIPIIQAIVDFIRTTWEIVSSWWTDNQNNIMNTASTVWNAIKSIFGSVITLIVGLVSAGLDQIKQFWDRWGTVITTIVQVAWAFISSAFSGTLKNILTVVSSVITQIRNIFQFAMDFIKNLVNTVLAFIRGDWDGVLSGIKGMVGAFKEYVGNTFENLMNTAKNLVQNGIDAISGFFDKLWDIDLAAAGKAIIDGFLGGLKSAYENVKNFVGGIADWIAENKGPISYDKKLLIEHGQSIMNGLNKGLSDSFKDVQKNIASMAGQMKVGFEVSANTSDFTNVQRAIPVMSPEMALSNGGKMSISPTTTYKQVVQSNNADISKVEQLLEVIATKEFAAYIGVDEIVDKTHKSMSKRIKEENAWQSRGSGVL